MARPIVLSNGELHVGLNRNGLVHDFYYPYVGYENHASGPDTRHKIGIWSDGMISWLDSDEWSHSFDYEPETLIGVTIATNDTRGIKIEFKDAVDHDISAFMRMITVFNLKEYDRDIRIFMHQAFAIADGRSNTDTAQYLPDSDAVLHYRGRRAFVVSGKYEDRPFDQYTIGLFGIEGREGTYRDAEDGELTRCNVEHGRVDSTIRFKINLLASASSVVEYWIAAGTSIRDALVVHKSISEVGIASRLNETENDWKKWLEPAKRAAEKMNPEFRETFIKSVLILKSQIDKRGAAIASTDTTMLNYSRDAYAYCWPRDGAYVMWPLIRMGYTEEPLRFFEFMKKGLHPGGYLMHKYRADGALGSSWHPYVHGDISGPPIQEDETAGVLFVFAEFYMQQNDKKLIDDYYQSMIVPMADFLCEYIDESTGLPKPSYDLWEEVYLTTTYTTAVTHAALLAAATLAEAANNAESAVKWRTVAAEMAEASKKHLYNRERQSFRKGLIAKEGTIHYDDTIDSSSLFGVFMYDLFHFDSDEVKAAVATLERTFSVSQDSPGIPRYENDNYHRRNPALYGNWWIITSLWLAQYYGMAKQPDRVHSVLSWVKDMTDSSGILPEQIDPTTGEFMSVAPLTWSHAEYIATLLDTI